MANAGDFTIDATDFKKAAAVLGVESKQLARDLELILLKGAFDLQGNLQRNVMAVPVSGRYPGNNVRATVAQAATLERTRGNLGAGGKLARVKVYINEEEVPAEHRAMVRLLNKRKFRHPVFGNKEVWVNQSGRPYIGRSATVPKRTIRTMIAAKMDGVARKIGRAT